MNDMCDGGNIKPSSLDWYKYCFVPSCKNTNSNAPTKDFIHVAWNPLKRKAWCDAVGYTKDKLAKTSFYCEDHFDVSNILCSIL